MAWQSIRCTEGALAEFHDAAGVLHVVMGPKLIGQDAPQPLAELRLSLAVAFGWKTRVVELHVGDSRSKPVAVARR